MRDEVICIRPHDEGWGFQHRAEIAGSYKSREEAAAAAQTFANHLLGADRNVMILVPTPAHEGEPCKEAIATS